jgi:hypothetical protein
MLTVVVESPYADDASSVVSRNVRYLRACLAYCLANNVAPYASHGLYTQPGVLNDQVPAERKNGMRAGFAIGSKLEERWFFIDLGMTDGMIRGEEAAKKIGQPTRRIRLPDWEKNCVREALIDRVFAGLLHREPSAPSRDVVASWTDEDLEQVAAWLGAPEDDTQRLPACLLAWALLKVRRSKACAEDDER